MIEWIFKLTDISSIKRISFRQDINGLRAIAVLAVVFYHADLELFKGGWLGVDIFFVISGYLISNIIISDLNDETFSFKNFYLRRVKRILPALFSTLLLTIPFAYFFLTPKAMEEYIDSLIASVFFYANYHFMNLDFYIAESTKLMPLIHTWSLAIEEQYYLLFPFLAFLVYKYFKKYFTFFIGFITVVSLYLNTLSQSSNKFYRLEFRIWELLLGVLVMILSSNLKIKHLEKIGLPLMLFPIFYFGDNWINDTEPKLIALLGISFIMFSNIDSSILSKVLSYKLISIIGLSSYSIYLLHQPLFAFFRLYKQNSWENYLKNTSEITSYDLILALIILISLGIASYLYIELIFLKTFNKIHILGFLVIFMVCIVGLINSKSYEEEYLNQISNTSSNNFMQDKISCHNRNLNNLCHIDNNSKINVYTLGDSSLVSTSYWLAKYSMTYNFNFTEITGSACLFSFEQKITDIACPSFDYEELKKLISNVTNSIIVFGGRLPLYESGNGFDNSIFKESANPNLLIDVKQDVPKTVTRLLEQNNIIILVYPIPEQGWDVLKLFNFIEFNLASTVSYPSKVWYERREVSYNILNSIESDSIYRIYPEKIFCDSFVDNQCIGAFLGKIYYIDGDHLSFEGGELVADQIIKVIESINNNK